MIKKVVLECNPDEILVKALGISKKEIQHQPNKGEVCNYQAKENVKFALVDEDPASGQPKYLNNFSLSEEKHGIKKMQGLHSDCVVLIIKPRLEEWIIDQCERSSISPKDFHLPVNAKDLKKVININLDRFKSLVNELKDKKSPGIVYLSELLNN